MSFRLNFQRLFRVFKQTVYISPFAFFVKYFKIISTDGLIVYVISVSHALITLCIVFVCPTLPNDAISDANLYASFLLFGITFLSSFISLLSSFACSIAE